MNNDVVYSNGAFDVFAYITTVSGKSITAYGIRRTDRPQDGMIFACPNKDYSIHVADGYKETLTKG